MGNGHDVAANWDPQDDLLGVIRELSSISAPAGHEDRMTAAVRAFLESRGLSVACDRLGQLAVSFGPADADNSVMVSAHLDELGLIVRAIDEGGWVRVHRLGGMPERVLPGLRMRIQTRTGEVPAIVGLKSHHLTPPEDKYVAKPATELYLDLGFSSRTEVLAAGVQVGDPITYAPSWDLLPGGRFAGKSLDDRVGVAALLNVVCRLIERPPTTRVHVAFSCLEEFHLRGTLTLAKRLQPTIACVVDIIPATDTPDLAGVGATTMGSGPSLSRMSFHGRGTLGGLIPHPALLDTMESAAAAAGVNVQYDAVIGVITDAAFLPMESPDGIAAIGVGIPCRYTHSPIETVQLSDVSDAAAMLDEFVRLAPNTTLDRGVAAVPTPAE